MRKDYQFVRCKLHNIEFLLSIRFLFSFLNIIGILISFFYSLLVHYSSKESKMSYESMEEINFQAVKVSLYREEDERSPKDFKWVLVDNRWIKAEEEED